MTLTGSSMETTGDDEGYWMNLMATFLLRYDNQLRPIASSLDSGLHFPLHIESILFPFTSSLSTLTLTVTLFSIYLLFNFAELMDYDPRIACLINGFDPLSAYFSFGR